MKSKQEILKEFRKIPGVGVAVSEDLLNLGYRSLDDLKGENPEAMYENLCKYQGCRVDRCMQYVFRCAVYFVSVEHHEPELLKWHNWKDKKLESFL